MYIPNPYFKNIPNIGSLVLDYIFIEDGYPILFTCTSNEKFYLCLCRTLTPEQKWIISEIEFQDLKKMIENKISIRDAFKANSTGKSCIAKWNENFISESYQVIPTSHLTLTELPENDVFLDDEDAELYLNQVENRIKNKKEKTIESQLMFDENNVTDAFATFDFLFSKNSNFLFYQDKNFEINTTVNVEYSIQNGKVNPLSINKEKIYNVQDKVELAA